MKGSHEKATSYQTETKSQCFIFFRDLKSQAVHPIVYRLLGLRSQKLGETAFFAHPHAESWTESIVLMDDRRNRAVQIREFSVLVCKPKL